MNLTVQHPVSYPFYMDSPRLRFALPWPTNPFQYSSPHPQRYYSSSYQLPPQMTPMSYPIPFLLSHPSSRPNPPLKPVQPYASYSNTRYNHLKQSTSHINRHRSVDASLHSQQYYISNHQYQASKTKSTSDFHHESNQNSARLLKAHSWHSMHHLNQSHMNFAKELPVIHEKQHNPLYSPPQKRKLPKNQLLLSSSPIVQKEIPEPGLVRISTLDEIPLIQNPIYKADITTPNINIDNKNNSNKKSHYKKSSSSSTCSSHSSLQKILNGTLRHDPLLTAAMEDFRQLRRTSSQSTPLTPHNRDLSRDSLCSDSICHSTSSSSSSSSSPPISRNHSHSSFTSLERLEIRNLIKTLRTNGLQSLTIPVEKNPYNPLPIIEQSKQKTSLDITQSANKPEKSSITEELEREFNKLRSGDPDHELIYVRPSLISKQQKTCSLLLKIEKDLQKSPTKNNDTTSLKQVNENQILSVPISQSTPKEFSETLTDEKQTSETKTEYAIPMKKSADVNLRTLKKEDQARSFSFCKPIHDIDREMRQTRPLSMFNWLNCGLSNPLPTTFQPNKTKNNEYESEYDKALVKENIYASDIDVHIPLSKDKEYLNNSSSMTDYLSDCKQPKNNSSILNDFSRLFTRFGNNKHEQKSKSKRKLHKNNNQHHNSRCSIM